MADLRVGIAEVDFTPPLGLPLMGNLRVDYAAKGIHDPLMAKALVFIDSAGTGVALLVVDLCMVARQQVAQMRAQIAAHCDLPAEHILIAATHTHSGPATQRLYTAPAAPDEAIAALLSRAAEAVLQARANLLPSTVLFATASEARLSFCRRLRCQDGRVHNNWEPLSPEFVLGPASPIEPQVNALSLERDGNKAGALVNFSLHPAIIGHADNRYSADYPGVLAACLRKACGPKFLTAFFNGCCGDINHINWRQPVPPGQEYDVVRHTGTLLAESTAAAISRSEPIVASPIRISSERVALKRLPVSEETYQWSLRAWEDFQRQPPTSPADGLPDQYRAPTWIEMYERQHEDDHAEVMAIRLGELAIVGFPGEMFSSFQRQIRAESPACHTLCIELANDAVGYLPTPEAFDQGGYESTPGATLYQEDAGKRLVSSALRQLRDLYR